MAPGSSLLVCSTMCKQRARAAPKGKAQGCAVPGIVLLLLTYLAYLALGTGVFWMLESPAAKDSSAKFQRDKWALLRNFTCLDSSALDSLIRGIVHAYQSGDIVLGNTTSMGRWEIMGSFFFSVSTITTIGHSQGPLAGRLLRPPLRPPDLPAAAPAALLLHGGLELRGGLLLRLHHPQHRGLRGLRDCHGPDLPRTSSSDLASPLGMDPSRRYPLWYKNTVSLWILFGMAWLALIIKLILSLMETPGRSCSCCHHSCKGDSKPQGWRQGPDEEAEPHCPQPGCYRERPVETAQHPEPSTQVSCCGKHS
ncbi:potassium channel subfamily K member 17 isoform X2 [Artibeus jamaicensis]|uniref:potassium channel subfamily K member 17 isoform X2 n=1 Tax=Artibeus jamaicensis TaxID=9417 RepID=UPI00235B25A9|nr:potassium channel subfamily K member 17 isoform X2 [Artibeus jamaicensis]